MSPTYTETRVGEAEERQELQTILQSPGFFDTLGITFLAGEDFLRGQNQEDVGAANVDPIDSIRYQ